MVMAWRRSPRQKPRSKDGPNALAEICRGKGWVAPCSNGKSCHFLSSAVPNLGECDLPGHARFEPFWCRVESKPTAVNAFGDTWGKGSPRRESLPRSVGGSDILEALEIDCRHRDRLQPIQHKLLKPHLSKCGRKRQLDR